MRAPLPTPSSRGTLVDPEPRTGSSDDQGSPATQEPNSNGRVTWEGPDEAVQTFSSELCGLEVIAFGQQNYLKGDIVQSVDSEIRYLGYHLGQRQLWGDLGTPSILYVTSDQGKTFHEWRATDRQC